MAFVLDDGIKRLYRLLTLYFTSNPEFEKHSLPVTGGCVPYNLNKGLLVIGSTGRSKTFCFEKVFRHFISELFPEKSYRVISSHSVQQSFESEGMKALNNYRRNSVNNLDNIYIDEIGMEELNVQHFGNKQSPMQTLLHERHRVFTQSCGQYKTHGSSNILIKTNKEGTLDFQKAYGDRIYSRLFEMFNIIVVSGPDLRINIVPNETL